MRWKNKKQKQKKLKTKYLFISDEINILGESQNICDTVRKLWTYYKCDLRCIYVAISNNVKTSQIRENCISIIDLKNVKTYKYLNKIITRDQFILHLECDK